MANVENSIEKQIEIKEALPSLEGSSDPYY